MGVITRTLPAGFVRRFALPGFLVLAFLYCLIPIEGGGANFAVFLRLCVASVVLLVVIVLFKPGLSKANAYFIGAILLFSIMSSLRGFGGGFFALGLSVVFGVTLSEAAVKRRLFRIHLSSAVLALIVISVFSLFLQIGIYIYTGVSLDLHKMLYPFSDARIAESFGLVRFTGLYIEPGTYSNWMYLLFMIYLALNADENPYIVYVVAGSMIATLSAWGMGVALFLVAVKSIRSVRYLMLLAVAVLVIFYFAPAASLDGALNILDHKLASDRVDAGAKIEAYEEFLRVFGDIIVVGYGFSAKFCGDCLSPQDAGLAINLSVVMGVLFVFGAFGYYFSALLRVRDFQFAVLSLPLFFSKAFYWDFVVWLIFFLVVSGRGRLGEKFSSLGRAQTSRGRQSLRGSRDDAYRV